VAALEQTTADVAFLIPAIMADLAQKPDLLEYCFRNLNFIFFAGGDLPQPLGDKIAAKIPIMSQYGSSEIGLALQLLAPPNKDADWRWVRFHPELGFDFEKITPGTFELVVKKDPRYEQYQMPFTISPGLKDLQEYRSRDLFVKHPSLPDTWSWRARADDIIVFLNGEKTNPVSMEQHIVVSNVEVTSALVFGMQQFQAGLLIETAEPFSRPIATKASALIDKIWPSIEKANMDAPAHARVEKSMIIFTSPDKPMIRSSKGTIQRQGTVVSYAEDIEETYRKADDALIHGAKSRIDTTNPEAVTDFIKQAIASINPDLLEDDKKSFFTLGLDSLMAMRLSRALKFGLGKLDLSASVIYNHPTVRQLVNHVIEKKRTSSTKAEAQQKAELETMVTELENLIQQIPTYNRTFRTAEESINEIVVLTGSTSSLGAHLLQALLETPRVNHVYCLDRNPNAGDVYRKKASLSGFPFQNHGDRVTFLHATLDKPNLGLEETIYEMLRSNVTLIIHNAWTVNFVIPLRTFRSQFDGMVNLFRLASTPTRHNSPRLLYISSISSVARFSSITGDDSIPETVIRNGSAAYQIGYARSKLLAELLCDAAARHLLLPIAFARVGQIAGPVGDANAQAWNIAEWFPSLVLTSISMGSLPDDFGVEANEIEWMPVDILAESLVELGLRHDGEAQLANAGAEAFNVNNPHSTTWKSLLPHVLTAIEKHFGKRVETIALTAWLEKLQDVVQSFSAERTDVAQTHPAIKLVDFYKGHFLNQSAPLKWDIHRATERSVVLRTMPAVGVEWIEKWVKEWAS
jgi:thioester reductase-like protein/acyl carrier protein